MNAVHKFEAGPGGRCTSGWYNDQNRWVECHSSQGSSTLDDQAEFRQLHDHGGGGDRVERWPSTWRAGGRDGS